MSNLGLEKQEAHVGKYVIQFGSPEKYDVPKY